MECIGCKRKKSRSELTHLGDEHYICESCESRRAKCDDCGDSVRASTIRVVHKEWYCEPCYDKTFEETTYKTRYSEDHYTDEYGSYTYDMTELYEAIRQKKWETDRHRGDYEERKEPEKPKEPSIASLVDKLMKEFDHLIGMEETKKEVRRTLTRQLALKRLQKNGSKLKIEDGLNHILVTGNAGVGKTEFLHVLTKVYARCGLIKEEKLVMVQSQDLIGQYVGHTAKETENKLIESKNGIFFVDEAYRLNSSATKGEKGNFGLEAIETIMSYMEKPNYLCAFAGYEASMQKFLTENPGLPSRIPNRFKLNDFTKEELIKMAKQHLTKQGFIFGEIDEALEKALKNEMNGSILEGNGRTLKTLVDKMIESFLNRIASEEEPTTPLDEITAGDILAAFEVDLVEQAGRVAILKEALDELDGMIGLQRVKDEVKKLVTYQSFQQKRRALGLSTPPMTQHMMLLGNPGTGKTVVARILGKIMRGLGILRNGHVIEASKDRLTAGDDVAATVKALVDEAMGGVLFVDEAYALKNDRKGKEALDSLIPLMENNLAGFCLILAGYKEDMGELFQLNAGLSSRVKQFDFDDYNAEELFDIFSRFISNSEYVLDVKREELVPLFEEALEKELVEGNGRWTRNLFEQSVLFLSERVMESSEPTLEDITTIELSDIKKALHQMSTVFVTGKDDEEKEEFIDFLRSLKSDKKLA